MSKFSAPKPSLLESKVLTPAFADEVQEAREAGKLGYMARVLVQVTLPHSNPRVNEYERSNGAIAMSLWSPREVGLPYGRYPRLAMCWMCTEAVRTQSRTLHLGRSLHAFMGQLGLASTGGREGNIGRFRGQMRRLVCSSLNVRGRAGVYEGIRNITLTDEAKLYWDPQEPRQESLWDSTLHLSEQFYKHIVNGPVPLDMRVLRELQSSLALDVYVWATHRVSYLRRNTEIPWEALLQQFGAGYSNTPQGRSNFRQMLLKALTQVVRCYPELKVSEGRGGLLLKPSRTHIRPKGSPLR